VPGFCTRRRSFFRGRGGSCRWSYRSEIEICIYQKGLLGLSNSDTPEPRGPQQCVGPAWRGGEKAMSEGRGERRRDLGSDRRIDSYSADRLQVISSEFECLLCFPSEPHSPHHHLQFSKPIRIVSCLSVIIQCVVYTRFSLSLLA